MKSIYKIVFFYFLFIQNVLNAQNLPFSWVRTMGTSQDYEVAKSIVLDSDKGVIAVGLFYDTIDIDASADTFNLISNGQLDVFITKYTSSGNFVWAKSFGGGPFDDYVEFIKNDQQGNLYLVGEYQNTVDFDPGVGVYNVSTTGIGSNTYILKLDKDGNFLWVKTFAAGFGNTLDIDRDGNILIGGSFGATVDFDPGPSTFNMTSGVSSLDMFVMKLDVSGNFLWARQIKSLGVSTHQEFGLETDTSGNVFFVGGFTDSIDFDPGPATVNLTSSGYFDAFILKLNKHGDYQWAKQFGSALSDDKVFGLEVDIQGNVYTTGTFTGIVDFDPGASSYFLSAPNNSLSTFISKLNNSGNFVYAKNFQPGESNGFALAIDSGNNLYISGVASSSVDFDPGTGIYLLPNSGLYIVKLNPNGNFIWAKGFSDVYVSGYQSIYSSIKVDQHGNIFFGGAFGLNVDFDPGIDSFVVSSNGVLDIFILKLGSPSCSNSTKKYINAQVCSNYVLNGVTYTNSGQYFQLLTNRAGCDSIIDIKLTIAQKQSNQTLASCGAILFNGKTYIASGIYRDTIHLSNGCDSIIVLNLTVNNRPVPNLGKDTVICIGDTIRLSAGIFASYQWNDGSSLNAINITQAGTYWLNATATNGCLARDSINILPSSNCRTCADSKLVEKVYPTPFKDILTVKIKPSACELSIDIFNTLGQIIIKDKKLNSGSNAINLEVFPSGAFFYRIHNGSLIIKEGVILKQ